MQLHVDIGSQICDLGLISGNECQNDWSSCLDIKLEINNGVYQMGVDDIWGYAICICGVRRYYLRKNKNLQLHNPQHVLKKFREPSRKRYKYLRSHVTCSQNSKDSTYVSIGVELGSLLVGITHDSMRQNVIDHTF